MFCSTIVQREFRVISNVGDMNNVFPQRHFVRESALRSGVRRTEKLSRWRRSVSRRHVMQASC